MRTKAVISAFLAISFALSANLASAAWEATFVDNFDGSTVDERAWAYGRENLVRRLQYYDKEAVSVQDGHLELGVLNKAQSDRPYSSGAVTTQGIFAQQYGYFEMRAKIPHGYGFWPSFWLMPVSGRWTSEIDIAEFRGFLPGNVHYAMHYGNRLRPIHELSTPTGLDLSNSYNVYAVRWTPESIEYLLNGSVIHSIDDPAVVANADSEMYMILNLALSSQHTTWNPGVNSTTDLSKTFSIDYVRVFQESDTGSYADIPAPTTAVPDIVGPAYDNTAVSIRPLDGSPNLMRQPGPISGTLELTSHKPDYQARMFLFLQKMNDFNPDNGNYTKDQPFEELVFEIDMDAFGAVQTVDYAFDTVLNEPGMYIMDVMIKDQSNNNKKRYAATRIVQYVDVDQPETTESLEGFFRPGAASYANGTVSATLQLQLQEALLAPFVFLEYQLVDTNTDELIATFTENYEHSDSGLQTLERSFPYALDTSRSVGLTVQARTALNTDTIARYYTHIGNTAALNPDWNPFSEFPAPPPPTPIGSPIPDFEWEPTFVDNFDGNSVRLDAWRPGWEHLARRMNYFDKDALRVSNGLLHIDVLNRGESDRGYTTGAMTTQGIFKQQYGYFEVRAKIPAGESFWPAFWLMPESGRWTSEIDVAEFRGPYPNSVHSAFHYGNRLHNEHSGDATVAIDLSQSFNTFAVYWTPDRIDYLLNGAIVHSIVGAQTVANANSDMFLILDLALSSQHASGWITSATSESDLDKSFDVDYVRVYRKDPAGRFQDGIPDHDTAIADLIPGPYDQTAASIDRVLADGETDIVRDGQPISGQIEVTAHRNGYSGIVSVFLTELTDINTSNGGYTKSPAISARNFIVNLSNVGDTQLIDYSFTDVPNGPAAYSVDVAVKDPGNNNKFLFGSHRLVQYVDASQPNSGIYSDGFVRSINADYDAGTITGSLDLQLQQSLLVPFLRLNYRVENANGTTVAQGQQDYQHDKVGRQTIPLNIATNLASGDQHTLTVSVSSADGNSFGEAAASLGGGTTEPPEPPEPPVGENTLHGVEVSGATATLDLSLLDISASDSLIYNVKFYQGNVLAGKFTGVAGTGFNPGRIDLPVSTGTALADGEYRVVAFIHRNSWSDRILFATQNITVAGGGPGPVAANELHGVSFVMFGVTAANLDLTLPEMTASDTLLYNVKFYSGNSLLEKVTGDAGNGFSANRFVLPLTVNSTTSQADRVVVFIQKNGWSNTILIGRQAL